MTFLRIVMALYLFDLSMIFSENRYPLFRIMLWLNSRGPTLAPGPHHRERYQVRGRAHRSNPPDVKKTRRMHCNMTPHPSLLYAAHRPRLFSARMGRISRP